jgi:hypothetical protein
MPKPLQVDLHSFGELDLPTVASYEREGGSKDGQEPG